MLLRVIDAPETRASGAEAIDAYERLARRAERDLALPIDPRVDRFIARIRARLSVDVDDAPRASSETVVRTAAPQPAPASPPTPPARRSTSRAMVGAALTAVALISLGVVIRSRVSHTALDRRRVIVEPFQNNTGDTSLARVGMIAADWITRGLSETEQVDVLDPAIEAPTPSIDPRELGARAGAGTVVMGSYVRAHDSITIDARIVNANDGRVVRAVDGVTGPVSDPLVAVQTIRRRVAAAMAVEVDGLIGSFGLSASEPPSYQAYLAWIEGLNQFTHRRFAGSAAQFKRAIALDSQFFAARLWLGTTYCNMGQLAACDSMLTPLVPRRATLAPLDRLVLDLWRSGLRGDLATRYTVTTEMVRRAPTSVLALYLAGISAIEVNRFDEGISLLRRIDPKDPGMPWDIWGTRLPRALHIAGRHAEELAEAERRLKHVPTVLAAMEERAIALAALDRARDAITQMDAMALAPPDSADVLGASLFSVARELTVHGHATEAAAADGRVIAWARERLDAGPAPDTVSALLIRALYERGVYAEALALADSRVKERPSNTLYLAMPGLVAARTGNRDEAEHVSRMLSRITIPYDQGRTSFERARIAALLGQRDAAVDLLRQARGEGRRIMELHLASEFQTLRGFPPFEALFAPR